MSATNRALVNQKLSCARALLKLINDLPAPLPANVRTLQVGLLQGAVFHLITAYRFYLREIAENHQIQTHAQINNENQLSAALESSGKASSDASELASLQHDSDSWLAKLYGAYAAIGQLPVKKDIDHAEAAHDHLIAAVLIDQESPDAEVLTAQQLLAWEKAFSDLISRQREVGAEY